MQELYERDKKIMQLSNENRDLKSENAELDSISQNYYELGGPLTTRSNKKKQLVPSTQVYTMRGS